MKQKKNTDANGNEARGQLKLVETISTLHLWRFANLVIMGHARCVHGDGWMDELMGHDAKCEQREEERKKTRVAVMGVRVFCICLDDTSHEDKLYCNNCGQEVCKRHNIQSIYNNAELDADFYSNIFIEQILNLFEKY